MTHIIDLFSTREFVDLLKQNLPGAHIVAIQIGDSPAQDQRRSYFDYANRQISEVCGKLKSDPRLKNGFNAIGLSQGGLMMRAYVEKCNNPPVKKLITFGSPLQGVSEFPGCRSNANSGFGNDSKNMKIYEARKLSQSIKRIYLRWPGWMKKRKEPRENLLPCTALKSLIGLAIYSSKVQHEIMPAQYFKDPKQISQYIKSTNFLVDLNNERTINDQYKRNIESLEQFVIFSFAKETIVIPAISTVLSLLPLSYVLGIWVLGRQQIDTHEGFTHL